MPAYGFECYVEDDGCGNQFDIICIMDEIQGKKPACPKCRKKKSVARNYDGNVYVCDSSPKTVGALAERNAARMSNDEMNEIKNKNRVQKPKFAGTLGEGQSLLPVDSKGKKIMPTKRMSKEKAKKLRKRLKK